MQILLNFPTSSYVFYFKGNVTLLAATVQLQCRSLSHTKSYHCLHWESLWLLELHTDDAGDFEMLSIGLFQVCEKWEVESSLETYHATCMHMSFKMTVGCIVLNSRISLHNLNYSDYSRVNKLWEGSPPPLYNVACPHHSFIPLWELFRRGAVCLPDLLTCSDCSFILSFVLDFCASTMG